MSPETIEIFAVVCVGMAVLATIWLLLALAGSLKWSNYVGVGGAAVAAIIVAGIWFIEYLPWIWMSPQLAMMSWLSSFVLIGIGGIFAFGERGAWKWSTAIVAFLALAFNACALLVFLWIATVSAGGV